MNEERYVIPHSNDIYPYTLTKQQEEEIELSVRNHIIGGISDGSLNFINSCKDYTEVFDIELERFYLGKCSEYNAQNYEVKEVLKDLFSNDFTLEEGKWNFLINGSIEYDVPIYHLFFGEQLSLRDKEKVFKTREFDSIIDEVILLGNRRIILENIKRCKKYCLKEFTLKKRDNKIPLPDKILEELREKGYSVLEGAVDGVEQYRTSF